MSATLDMRLPEIREQTPAAYQRIAEEWIPGNDAWSREARIVFRLAAEAGIRVDLEQLIYADVHDLQALERGLRKR